VSKGLDWPVFNLVADSSQFIQYRQHGPTENKAIKECKEETEKTMNWFLKSGLCVNKKKTEFCVFNKSDTKRKELILGGEKVQVLKEIKVLGLVFDSKLNWYQQTMLAIEKANKAKQGLRLVSKYFSKTEMINLATSLFYSRLYYLVVQFFGISFEEKTLASFIKNATNCTKRLVKAVFI
jgi:hypothetical protein